MTPDVQHDSESLKLKLSQHAIGLSKDWYALRVVSVAQKADETKMLHLQKEQTGTHVEI